jgi:saccharopine dehydrogenase-like NADP-dependent oxidoreductase
LLNEFKDLGFMSQEKLPKMIHSWAELTNSLILSKDISQNALNVIKWLGLFDPSTNTAINKEFDTYLDVFSHLLQDKLTYASHERDMILLHHNFIVYNSKFQSRRSIQVSLCEYGTEEFSAMARTVGIPVAHAAWKILEKEIVGVKGVKAPIEPEIYKPILKDLSIKFH